MTTAFSMKHEATPPASAAKYAAMGVGRAMGVSAFVGIGGRHTGTDEVARTHGKVRNSPVSKHAHTPASAAVGIEHAIRMLDGRWKLVILFHLFGGKTLRFSDLERAIPGISQKMLTQQLCQLEQDQHRHTNRAPCGSAEGRISPHRVGTASCPALDRLLTWAGHQPSLGARDSAHGRTRLLNRCPPSDRYAFRNVSRSALIVSASVVGIPCGKPL